MITMVNQRTPGGVQSVHRALDLLEVLTEAGGRAPIASIATSTGLPLPTTHRLLQTLVERGYVRQLPNRQYALGVRLAPLGAAAGRLINADATTVLSDLVAATGESANLAVLSGDHAEYVAQVPSRHSMRTFTEVGRRVELHCTGVGKAILAQLSPDQVEAIVERRGLVGHTEYTHVAVSTLRSDLTLIRERGYALDEQEQELGVRCVAVAVPDATASWSAVSVSGPLTRMTDQALETIVPAVQESARRLAAMTERTIR